MSWIVGEGILVEPHGAFDLLRDDYLKFDRDARWTRTHYGLTNDGEA